MIRSVRDVYRDDRARIATCTLRTPTDRHRENYSIDFYILLRKLKLATTIRYCSSSWFPVVGVRLISCYFLLLLVFHRSLHCPFLSTFLLVFLRLSSGNPPILLWSSSFSVTSLFLYVSDRFGNLLSFISIMSSQFHLVLYIFCQLGKPRLQFLLLDLSFSYPLSTIILLSLHSPYPVVLGLLASCSLLFFAGLTELIHLVRPTVSV